MNLNPSNPTPFWMLRGSIHFRHLTPLLGAWCPPPQALPFFVLQVESNLGPERLDFEQLATVNGVTSGKIFTGNDRFSHGI